MGAAAHPRIKKMSPQFLVADLERAIEFYTKKLGFAIEFRYEDFYAGIIKDGLSIHLKTSHPLAGIRQLIKESEHLDLIISVGDIEWFYKDFLKKAVEVTQPLREMPYGREFYIADPDGYIIAFLEEV